VRAVPLAGVLLFTLVSVLLFRFFDDGSGNEREFRLRSPVLGTFATYIVLAGETSGDSILLAMDSLARALDRELGFFGNGELSRLNSTGGAALNEISDDLLRVLKKSVFMAEITDTLFDPSLGNLMVLWDFGAEGIRKIPDSSQVAGALALSGFSGVNFSGDSIRLSDGVKLDLGAIAKGYVSDRVYALAMTMGASAALVEIGGEIRCGGDASTGRTWSIGVKDPRKDGLLDVFEIEGGAVATSGDYESFFVRDGVRYCHILDPRTGYPERGVLSVTVISDSASTADALATAIAVGGVPTAEALPDSLFRLIVVVYEAYDGSMVQWRRKGV